MKLRGRHPASAAIITGAGHLCYLLRFTALRESDPLFPLELLFAEEGEEDEDLPVDVAADFDSVLTAERALGEESELLRDTVPEPELRDEDDLGAVLLAL